MPNLDRFKARQADLPGLRPIGGPQIPQVRQVDAGAAFQVVSEGIKDLGELAERFRQRDLSRKVSNAKVDILGQLNTFEAGLAGRSDYDNFIGEYQALTDGLRKQYGEQFKDVNAQAAINLYLDERSAYGGPRVALKGWKVQRQVGKADALIKIKDFYNMIQSADVDKMDVLKTQFVNYVNEQEAGGFLEPGEAKTHFEAFDYLIKKEQTWRFVQSQTYEEGLKFLRNDENLPDISDTDRKGMIAEAKQIEGERRDRERKADAELQDQLYQDFAKKFDDGTLTADYVKASGASGALLEQYLSKLRIKANAQIKGDENPFEITNPNVYATVSKKLAFEPESMDKKYIWGFHGDGLSTKMCEYFQARWEEQIAPDRSPNLKALVQRWHKHINTQRENGLWADEFEIDTPEGIEENNAGYMRIAQGLDELIMGNPNITNDEIQTWYDGQVKPVEEEKFRLLLGAQNLITQWSLAPLKFLESVSGPAEQKSSSGEVFYEANPDLSKREQAIKFLEDNGWTATEERITIVMEQL